MTRLAVVLALVLAFALAMPAAATIAPRNCGPISAKGVRYTVKAHIVGCSKAKPWADRYLETGRKPSGYSCRKYDPDVTRIRFRCTRGTRDFYAIRR